MQMTRVLVASVALGAVAVAPNAGAQSRQPWSVQGSLLYTVQDIGGSAGNIGGTGIEAQLRRTFPRWSLGGGMQYSKHSKGPDDLSLTGFFVEPRFLIPASAGAFVPYLAGRLAVLRGSLDAGRVEGSGSSSGFAAGAGAGVIYGLTRRVNIDVGGAFLRQSLSNITLDDTGNTELEFPSFFGYVLKGGFSVGF